VFRHPLVDETTPRGDLQAMTDDYEKRFLSAETAAFVERQKVPNPHAALIFFGATYALALVACVASGLRHGEFRDPGLLVALTSANSFLAAGIVLNGIQRTVVTAEELIVEVGLSRRRIPLAAVRTVEAAPIPSPLERARLALRSFPKQPYFNIGEAADCVRITYVEGAVERQVVIASRRPLELAEALELRISIPRTRVAEPRSEEEKQEDDAGEEVCSSSRPHRQERTS
jgi:hypothetical protein